MNYINKDVIALVSGMLAGHNMWIYEGAIDVIEDINYFEIHFLPTLSICLLCCKRRDHDPQITCLHHPLWSLVLFYFLQRKILY